MNSRNAKTISLWLQHHTCLGIDTIGPVALIIQNFSQSHGETSRVSRTQQFLRVSSLAAIKTGVIRVGPVLQHTAISRHGPLALLDTTFPMSTRIALHRILLP